MPKSIEEATREAERVIHEAVQSLPCMKNANLYGESEALTIVTNALHCELAGHEMRLQELEDDDEYDDDDE